MSWSFDDSLPTAKDRVRVLIQDVDDTNPLLSDEMIGLLLPGGMNGQSSESLAAAECARMIGTKFASRATSMSAGGTTVNWGDISKRYFDLAAQLRTVDLQGDGTGLFDIAEMNFEPFGSREILRNEILRSGL